MEYLPLEDLQEWGGDCINPLNTKKLFLFAEEVDAYVWANGDMSTEMLLETIRECCAQDGLGVGAA